MRGLVTPRQSATFEIRLCVYWGSGNRQPLTKMFQPAPATVREEASKGGRWRGCGQHCLHCLGRGNEGRESEVATMTRKRERQGRAYKTEAMEGNTVAFYQPAGGSAIANFRQNGERGPLFIFDAQPREAGLRGIGREFQTSRKCPAPADVLYS